MLTIPWAKQRLEGRKSERVKESDFVGQVTFGGNKFGNDWKMVNREETLANK